MHGRVPMLCMCRHHSYGLACHAASTVCIIVAWACAPRQWGEVVNTGAIRRLRANHCQRAKASDQGRQGGRRSEGIRASGRGGVILHPSCDHGSPQCTLV